MDSYLICGKIEQLSNERKAGWDAFFKADYELDDARAEIKRLQKIISGCKLCCKQSKKRIVKGKL